MARYSEEILLLWKEYFKVAKSDRSMRIDDQTLFWDALRSVTSLRILPIGNCSHQNPRPVGSLVTCHPHSCVTGTGAVTSAKEFLSLKENIRKLGLKLVAVHANYMVGNDNKMRRLQESGLWLSQKSPSGAWDIQCNRLNTTTLDGLL